MASKIELGLKAQRSRHPYIRELGSALLGRGDPVKLAALHKKPGPLMPSQLRLISEITAAFNIEEYLESD